MHDIPYFLIVLNHEILNGLALNLVYILLLYNLNTFHHNRVKNKMKPKDSKKLFKKQFLVLGKQQTVIF